MPNIRNFFLLFFFSYATYAGTPKLPFVVAADSAHYNFKNGIHIYEGQVKIDQGDSHLLADRVITKNNMKNHHIEEAIAYGLTTLAEYWQTAAKKPMHAKASIIQFYPQQSLVILKHHALITQGKNSFHGELIHYNINEETITVPRLKHSRAILIYHSNS